MNVKILKSYKGLRKGQMLKMSHFVSLAYKGREVVGVALKPNENSKKPILRFVPLELTEFFPDELTYTAVSK